MNEKAQIENYLEQKVNPLMEELLTNITRGSACGIVHLVGTLSSLQHSSIKNRPKNIVIPFLFSLTTAEDGLIKKQNISKCSPTSQIQTLMKISIELYILIKKNEAKNGMNKEKEFAEKYMEVIIYGKISMCK